MELNGPSVVVLSSMLFSLLCSVVLRLMLLKRSCSLDALPEDKVCSTMSIKPTKLLPILRPLVCVSRVLLIQDG